MEGRKPQGAEKAAHVKGWRWKRAVFATSVNLAPSSGFPGVCITVWDGVRQDHHLLLQKRTHTLIIFLTPQSKPTLFMVINYITPFFCSYFKICPKPPQLTDVKFFPDLKSVPFPMSQHLPNFTLELNIDFVFTSLNVLTFFHVVNMLSNILIQYLFLYFFFVSVFFSLFVPFSIICPKFINTWRQSLF